MLNCLIIQSLGAGTVIDDTFLARHCVTLMRHQDSWVLCYLIRGRDTLIEIAIALVSESRWFRSGSPRFCCAAINCPESPSCDHTDSHHRYRGQLGNISKRTCQRKGTVWLRWIEVRRGRRNALEYLKERLRTSINETRANSRRAGKDCSCYCRWETESEQPGRIFISSGAI